MTDPKAGIANIKKKMAIPNYNNESKETIAVFQRKTTVKVEVSDYNSKAGNLKL